MAKANEIVRPVIVKKIYEAPHAGHHGGAWKVAYADFVTAMMAFFLLMWLLGATTEKQRKALADYFAPTIVQMKQESAGSNGFFGGDSITSVDNYPNRQGQTGTRSITIPQDATGGPKEAMRRDDRSRFERMKAVLEKSLKNRKDIVRFRKNIRFTDTRDGLRIDMVDEADFTMFASGTSQLTPDAQQLLREVAVAIRELPNAIIIRGHTDSMPYRSGKTDNNWQLSSQRAEVTRSTLMRSGIAQQKFARIEGVADNEPYIPTDRYDPRNRRMSITLGWTQGEGDNK